MLKFVKRLEPLEPKWHVARRSYSWFVPCNQQARYSITKAAGPDVEAAGPGFEAAGPDFEDARPDFEAAGRDSEAARPDVSVFDKA